MFTNIFYFIVVFTVFAFYEPGENSFLPLTEVVLSIILSFLFFIFYNRFIFNRLVKRIYSANENGYSFASLHAKIINNSIIFAVAIFAAFTYFFDIKFYFLKIPFLNESEFAANLFCIIIFSTLLLIIWINAFKSYSIFLDSSISLKNYLISHFRLNIVIVIPWLIFSIAFDAAKLLPESIIGYINDNSYISYFIFSLFLIAVGCFFPFFLVKIWKCKPLPNGVLRERLEEFCKKAKFAYSDILLWNLFDGKLITAGVLGFMKKFRYLLISPSLLNILDDYELESVVAHEIGHVKNRHMIFFIFFILGYGIFSLTFFNIIFYGILSHDIFFNFFINNDGSLKTGFYLFPISILIIFLLLYFRFLFGVFSRNFERQSDLHAIKILGDGSGIISSLDKIASAGSHSRNAPNWHHYSIQERIKFLKDCEMYPELVKVHDRKVKRLVALYFVALISLVGFLFALNSSVLYKSELNLVEKILEKKLEIEPDNPSFHYILANVYFENKKLSMAEKQYLITLSLKPYFPEALNNLAWLYATSEDKNIRKPEEALKYSLLAAKISSEPHILDTLAESYFINGYFEEAIETIELAISMKPDNISYYEKQLKKFKSSLKTDFDKNNNGTYSSEHISI